MMTKLYGISQLQTISSRILAVDGFDIPNNSSSHPRMTGQVGTHHIGAAELTNTSAVYKDDL